MQVTLRKVCTSPRLLLFISITKASPPKYSLQARHLHPPISLKGLHRRRGESPIRARNQRVISPAPKTPSSYSARTLSKSTSATSPPLPSPPQSPPRNPTYQAINSPSLASPVQSGRRSPNPNATSGSNAQRRRRPHTRSAILRISSLPSALPPCTKRRAIPAWALSGGREPYGRGGRKIS